MRPTVNIVNVVNMVRRPQLELQTGAPNRGRKVLMRLSRLSGRTVECAANLIPSKLSRTLGSAGRRGSARGGAALVLLFAVSELLDESFNINSFNPASDRCRR